MSTHTVSIGPLLLDMVAQPKVDDELMICRAIIKEYVHGRRKFEFSLGVASRLLVKYEYRKGDMWGSLERKETKWYKDGDAALQKLVVHPESVRVGGCVYSSDYLYLAEWGEKHPFCAATELLNRADEYLEWKRHRGHPRSYDYEPWWMRFEPPPPIKIPRLNLLRHQCKEYIEQARAAVAEAPDWKTLVIRFCGEYSEGHNFLAAQLAIMSKLIPTLYYGNKEESKELYYELVYMRVSTRKFANANVTE